VPEAIPSRVTRLVRISVEERHTEHADMAQLPLSKAVVEALFRGRLLPNPRHFGPILVVHTLYVVAGD
jgi:hypothetical protein